MLLTVIGTVLIALIAPSHQQSNRSPTFVEDLSGILVNKGLYENTTVGTVIGKLSCSDPDGDPIVYYAQGSSSLSVAPLTGEVKLERQLDREQSVNSLNPNEKPNSVTFLCVDYDSATRQEKSISRTRVDLVITVQDNNDEEPQFTISNADGFTFYIKEIDPVGTVLEGVISITDEDIGVNAKLESVDLDCEQDQEPCQVFRLTSNEDKEGLYLANLVLQQSLDYETRTDYRTRIKAIDGPGLTRKNTASIGIRIVVEDSQDTDPIFTNQDLNFDVNDGDEAGTILFFGLSARDGDRGAKRKIFLEVLDDPNGINLFEAQPAQISDPTRGIYQSFIVVKNKIDREDSRVGSGYTFKAKATEIATNGSLTTATATQTFTVNIRDINDNPPTFSESTYTVSVREMAQVNASVQIPNLKIVVNDPDEPTNARYRLEVVSQSQPGAFGFTPDSLVSNEQNFYLTVNSFQFMDYEVLAYRRQIIELRAVEYLSNGQRGTKSSTATVTVTLSDANDNFPRFTPSSYEVSIREDAANFTSLTRVSATDADPGLNGEVIYSLEDRARSMFYINPQTGDVRLMNKLDYENQREYSFLALAFDRQGRNDTEAPKSSQAVVRIIVTDFNDQGPVFTLTSYNARVNENSLQFESEVRVAAIDPDPDARVTYRIVSGNTPDPARIGNQSFVLGSTSGVLSLSRELNYENTPNQKGIYRLIVEASDNGSPAETATSVITVTVVDQNNHSPVFSPTTYSRTVSEAENPGTSLLRVTATDSDFGSNGEISYRIGTGGRDSFVVDSSGNVLISNNPSLDYDDIGNQAFTVQIIAVDGGSPQRSATASIFVTVTDANNKAPRFSTSLFNKIVDETSNVGTSVLTVSATDSDQGSSLRYSIVQNSIIAINKAGGQVGSIFPYDYRTAFTINPVTGLITVGSVLDRNYVVELSFKVEVEDVNQSIGNNKDSSQVSITISGKPNTELFYNQPWTKNNPSYVVPLLESSPPGTEILTLQARDPADGSSVLEFYTEVQGTDNGDYFRIITKTDSRGVTPGVVVLNRALDYESRDLVHSVSIRASKDTRSVIANVTITVADFNDNPPEFTPTFYSFTVSEAAAVNQLLGSIQAIDRDSASFGPIEFTLAGGIASGDFQLFQPNEDGTAELLVAKPLDFENRSRYDIDVFATDNKFGRGSAIRLASKAVISIQVQDENDNTPTFTDRERNFSVPETAARSTSLGQILATDADFNLNGQILYSLARYAGFGTWNQDKALQLFAISEQSGVLFTKASLRGLSGVYKFQAIARDRGSPQLSSSMNITVKIQGAEDDDGTPQWISPVNEYIVYHTEHTTGRLNVNVSANARTPNAKIVYSFSTSFSNDYTKFNIDSNTGRIDVVGDLDREIQARYTLLIKALDSLNTTKISSRTLIVDLIDVDDNSPSFMKSQYAGCPNDFEVPKFFSAVDNTPSGQIVAEAKACDPDGPSNSNAYYYLFNGNDLCSKNDLGVFTVNLNGTVVNKKMLDYEEKTEYLICVEVRKTPASGRRKREFPVKNMTDTDRVAYLVVKIIDINDNGPTFPDDIKTAVLDAVPTEPTVIQVTANDPDGPVYGRIRYDITATTYYPPNSRPYSMRGAFAIDGSTGEITTNLPSYSEFAEGYFLITVAAFDLENTKMNDTMTVKVIVYRRSQMLRVVLDKTPSEGQSEALTMIGELNQVGNPDQSFFFKSASEHRTGNDIVATQTDICFVVVENNKPNEASAGIQVIERSQFDAVLQRYKMINRGTCYALRSSEDGVKWKDLWWVLVIIAIFIFVCTLILIGFTCILFDRYKDHMKAETYMVPQ